MLKGGKKTIKCVFGGSGKRLSLIRWPFFFQVDFKGFQIAYIPINSNI